MNFDEYDPATEPMSLGEAVQFWLAVFASGLGLWTLIVCAFIVWE